MKKIALFMGVVAGLLLSKPLQGEVFEGQLPNGMVLIHGDNDQMAHSTVVRLSLNTGNIAEGPTESGRMELLLHALFYGTQDHNAQELAAALAELGLNSDPSTHVRVGPLESSIEFQLSHCGDDVAALRLLHELICRPLLDLSAISMAQNSLGTAFSVQEIQQLFEEVVRPNRCALVVMSDQPMAPIRDFVESLFSGWRSSDRGQGNVSLYPAELIGEPVVTKAPRRMPPLNACDVLVDEKILMREPSWYQSKSTGYWIGGGLLVAMTAVLAAGLIFMPPAAAAAFIFVPGACFFLAKGYMHDPEVLAEARQRNLIEGFDSTYSEGNTLLTLTPAENRKMFLEGNIYAPASFCGPIVNLARNYRLSDPTFIEMLLLEERVQMKGIRDNFLMDKNYASLGQQRLKQELAEKMIPYEEERDRELQRLKSVHDENYYVRRELEEREKRDKAIQQAWEDFLAGLTSEVFRDEVIAVWQHEYESVCSALEFKAGLERSEAAYTAGKQAAGHLYDEQKDRVKHEMHYDERMGLAGQRLDELRISYDHFFREYLTTLPISLPEIVDYRDLRFR